MAAPGLQDGPLVKSLDTTAQGASLVAALHELSHTIAGRNCLVRMTPLAGDLEALAWSVLGPPYIRLILDFQPLEL